MRLAIVLNLRATKLPMTAFTALGLLACDSGCPKGSKERGGVCLIEGASTGEVSPDACLVVVEDVDHGHLSHEEAAGTFTWMATDDGRNAIVRSNVSGREGVLARSMFRRA